MKRTGHTLVCALFLILSSTGAVAAPTVNGSTSENGPRLSKIGSEIKAIKTPASLGILFGWRYTSYESDTFSVGGAAYTGQLSSPVGSFSYGGLVAAYTVTGRTFEFDLNLLTGGGGGAIAGVSSAGIILEPGFGISAVLGKSVRTSLNLGFAWMPNATDFSGITVGLRFDFLLNGS